MWLKWLERWHREPEATGSSPVTPTILELGKLLAAAAKIKLISTKKMITWHNLKKGEVLRKMKVDEKNGLSAQEVSKRKEKWGKNEIRKAKTPSLLEVFLRQFKNPLVYILLIVFFAILILRRDRESFFEAGFILVAILINASFGTWEEYKAEKTFKKLKDVLQVKAVVLRGGNKKEINREELVPGDIIFLSSGAKIPADARVVKSDGLEVSEAALTGEWLPVKKTTQAVDEKTSLGDRSSMIYAGSLVEAGEGKAVVVATGDETKVGEINVLVEEAEKEKSPLQKKLASFVNVIGSAVVFLSVLIFAAGLLRGGDPVEIFETAAAVAVGGIPESLPIVMTLTLAIGMERLARKKGLIKRLRSVETLGSTSVICCDKTKTLTLGEMKPSEVIGLEEEFEIKEGLESSVYNLALKGASLANAAFVENPEDSFKEWRVRGEPTDRALLQAALEAGKNPHLIRKEVELLDKKPFDSYRGYQAYNYQEEGSVTYLSGAPEKVLEISNRVETEEGTKKMKEEERRKLLSKLESHTKKGERVIALAYKKEEKLLETEEGFTFVAMITLEDPLRPGVKEAITECRNAGLRTVIVTGDYKNTAQKIAGEIGINAQKEEILLGSRLEKMSVEELAEKVEEVKIYARSAPKDKIKIVEAWQKKQAVVAMTGDGINDAPALKKADIGIAVGSGTEVAKSVADLVLLEDGFDVIVKAVEQGRGILDNLRKSIGYVLSDSFASIILVGSSIALGWPLPILWTQILWNNVFEDSFPSISYAFEPVEDDVMKRKPEDPSVPLLTKSLKALIFIAGIIDELFLLLLFWFIYFKMGMSLEHARTIVFGAFCLDTAFVIYSFKNFRKNVWEVDILNNKWLLVSSVVIVFSLAMAVYLPFLQKILNTTPLSLTDWGIITTVAILSVSWIEITKFILLREKQN